MIKNKINLEKFNSFLIALPWYVFLLSMVFLPTEFKRTKIVILILLLLEVFIMVLFRNKGSFKMKPVIFLWFLFYASVGVFFAFIGLLRGAPSVMGSLRVFVLWPICYLILITAFVEFKYLKHLVNLLVASSFFIGLFSIWIVLYRIGIIPDYLYPVLFNKQSASIENGQLVAMHFKSIDSLLFLVPFIISSLITWPTKYVGVKFKCLLLVAFLILLIPSFMGARNALTGVVILSPFISFFITKLTNTEYSTVYSKISYVKIALFVSCVVLVSSHFLQIDLSAIFDKFINKFDYNNNGSAIIRRDQFVALWRAFLTNPILGAGFGNTLNSPQFENVTGFELSYLFLLFQSGILGFILYSSGILWLYYQIIMIMKKEPTIGVYLHPILVGMTCFLLANATNQYLLTFDYMWVIFIPVAIVNLYYVSNVPCKDKY